MFCILRLCSVRYYWTLGFTSACVLPFCKSKVIPRGLLIQTCLSPVLTRLISGLGPPPQTQDMAENDVLSMSESSGYCLYGKGADAVFSDEDWLIVGWDLYGIIAELMEIIRGFVWESFYCRVLLCYGKSKSVESTLEGSYEMANSI